MGFRQSFLRTLKELSADGFALFDMRQCETRREAGNAKRAV